MATDLGVDDVLLVQTACFCNGQLGLNSWFFQVASVIGEGTFDTLVAATFDDLAEDAYKAYLGNDASYYGVKVTIVNRAVKPIPVVSASNIGVGLQAGGSLPGQVCGVITKRTASTGRAYRGRCYLPFPGAGLNDAVNNRPTDAGKALMETVGERFDKERTIGDEAAGVIVVPGLWRPTLGFTPVTDHEARGSWGTQRRRGNYGKVNVYPPF